MVPPSLERQKERAKGQQAQSIVPPPESSYSVLLFVQQSSITHTRMPAHVFVAALLAALLACSADAVDRSKFRTCKDASFCRRHRDVVSEPAVRGCQQ